MFENVGKKIMDCVTIITIVGCIGFCIFGLILLGTVPLIGVLVMIIGCLLTWISGFVLYGFGRLIHNSEQLNELQEMKKAIKTLNTNLNWLMQQQENGTQIGITSGQTADIREKAAQTSEKPASRAFGVEICNESFYFPTREEGEIFCPNCGTKQKGNRDKCWECSAKFVYEDEKNE